MENLRHLRPILAAILAFALAHCHVGCVPAKGPNEEYNKAIIWCAQKAVSLQESCICRKAMDKQYGICDGPGPHYGRCDYDCYSQPGIPTPKDAGVD